MRVSVSTVFLRLSIGAFFVILGLFGILPTVDEGIFSLANNAQWLEVLFGAVEMACGAFLVASVFVLQRSKVMSTATALILVFWLVRVALSRVFWGIDVVDSGLVFKPTFASWLIALSAELVIASGVGILFKAYRD